MQLCLFNQASIQRLVGASGILPCNKRNAAMQQARLPASPPEVILETEKYGNKPEQAMTEQKDMIMAYMTAEQMQVAAGVDTKTSLPKRVFGALFGTANKENDASSLNSLKDWNPAKLRSFGYTEVEIEYLFAKANKA